MRIVWEFKMERIVKIRLNDKYDYEREIEYDKLDGEYFKLCETGDDNIYYVSNEKIEPEHLDWLIEYWNYYWENPYLVDGKKDVIFLKPLKYTFEEYMENNQGYLFYKNFVNEKLETEIIGDNFKKLMYLSDFFMIDSLNNLCNYKIYSEFKILLKDGKYDEMKVFLSKFIY